MVVHARLRNSLQRMKSTIISWHGSFVFALTPGLAHLEALEMLSNQSEKRVNSLLNALPPETITAVKPQLLKIKENFEIGEEEEDVEEQDFVRLVTELFTSLGLGNTPAKLTKVSLLDWLPSCSPVLFWEEYQTTNSVKSRIISDWFLNC